MQRQWLQMVSIITGIFALSSTTNSYADFMSCMSAPFGWYFEGNIGSTRVSNISFPGSASSSGLGANLNLGYKFMPYFGLEIGYTRYADTTIEDQTGTKAATIKHFTYDLAARGILPMSSSGFELFAKVGVQRNNADMTVNNSQAAINIGGTSSSNNKDTGLYLGVGGQYYFNPQFAVVVQWQRADGNGRVGVLDLYSIGASFIFA